MQNSRRPAVHWRKVSGALLIGILSAAAVIGTLRAQFQGTLPGTASEIVLHSFSMGRAGANPEGGMVRDPAGNLYGTTQFGGAGGQGVVFKVDATGHETVLYSFSGGADGGEPFGLIRDSAGNLYGTTQFGGITGACAFVQGCGVVYKLDAAGHYTVLHSFTGGADGSRPQAGVVRDSAGNLYGTTWNGGSANDAGIVYKLDAAGHETVLYTFTGGADGGNPTASPIRDSAGNLYGTTQYAGNTPGCIGGCGVVFKLDATGQYTLLYTFTGGADGGNPLGGVIRDSAGNLYGTASVGPESGQGPCLFGCGVVFKLDATGHETVLHSFTGGADGGMPIAGVIRDSAGNLYGTTSGTVFKLDATGNYTVLSAFTGGADGGTPSSGVIVDFAGNLYGTAFGVLSGANASQGVVYKLDPTGHETVLYTFPEDAGGYAPSGGVIGDSAGNLYGTTQIGGSANLGVVYKLDPAGQETVLHTFTGADGVGPASGVIRDPAGNLYGTTQYGGITNCAGASVFQSGCGVVFKLDAAGHYTVLYKFTGGVDGFCPNGLIRDSAGNLYGTTCYGGSANAGVVYKLDAAGHYTVLYSFTNGRDGSRPQAGVIRDLAGNLYGTTQYAGNTPGCAGGCGVVFRLDVAGLEIVLHSFTGGDGANPAAGVIGEGDGSGNAYGTTLFGGTAGVGVVYKLDAALHETVLYSFTGMADGRGPTAGVIRDSAGNLYGTASAGGDAICGCGVVFKLDAAGHETVLHTFTGGVDGGGPTSGLIPDSAGNLYGTAGYGGAANAGVVYRIKP
jgi:uncharacterized repeat protein (TIGR03803 family)